MTIFFIKNSVSYKNELRVTLILTKRQIGAFYDLRYEARAGVALAFTRGRRKGADLEADRRCAGSKAGGDLLYLLRLGER